MLGPGAQWWSACDLQSGGVVVAPTQILGLVEGSGRGGHREVSLVWAVGLRRPLSGGASCPVRAELAGGYRFRPPGCARGSVPRRPLGPYAGLGARAVRAVPVAEKAPRGGPRPGRRPCRGMWCASAGGRACSGWARTRFLSPVSLPRTGRRVPRGGLPGHRWAPGSAGAQRAPARGKRAARHAARRVLWDRPPPWAPGRRDPVRAQVGEVSGVFHRAVSTGGDGPCRATVRSGHSSVGTTADGGRRSRTGEAAA